ncbi:N-acetylglucosamine kinase [Agathobaculum sp. Marseille-P7918]|uniref:N-acetylglucosamine kinase n=1 Tax=Agathobaculum sp. Marseille-P7918 TaxID=2479843 RepID=UPI003566D01A
MYIGIDGGGTKTKFTLFDAQGHVQDECVKPTVHVLTQSREDCIRILAEGVQMLDPEGQARVVAGLAGYGQQESVRKTVQDICACAFTERPHLIFSDVQIALSGALDGQDGIVVIAGTGSIAFAQQNGVYKRCGGWGYQLGDEGSAYWIAKKMLAVYCQQVDGRLEKSCLYDLVQKACALENEHDIISYVAQMHSHRTEVAALARLNGQAAQAGDEYALEIYQEAAAELSRLIVTLSSDFQKPFPVSYIGGVFEHAASFMLEPLEKNLSALPCTLVSPAHTPEYGAYLLGKTQGL